MKFIQNTRAALTPVAAIEMPGERTAADYAALAIAAGGGAGYLRAIPATWGSLLGVFIYLSVQAAGERLAAGSAAFAFADDRKLETLLAALPLPGLIVLFLIGTWASNRVVDLAGKKDPRLIVIDEIVGQMVALFLIPGRIGWQTALLGFLAFRFFDVWKLYPANVFESLPSGLGVMTDDLMAGFYAAATVSVLSLIYFSF